MKRLVIMDKCLGIALDMPDCGPLKSDIEIRVLRQNIADVDRLA